MDGPGEGEKYACSDIVVVESDGEHRLEDMLHKSSLSCSFLHRKLGLEKRRRELC